MMIPCKSAMVACYCLARSRHAARGKGPCDFTCTMCCPLVFNTCMHARAQTAGFMFATTGSLPLAELYSPLHRLMGAGHIAVATSFWALRVRGGPPACKLCSLVGLGFFDVDGHTA